MMKKEATRGGSNKFEADGASNVWRRVKASLHQPIFLKEKSFTFTRHNFLYLLSIYTIE
jgi:hypothetical protein